MLEESDEQRAARAAETARQPITRARPTGPRPVPRTDRRLPAKVVLLYLVVGLAGTAAYEFYLYYRGQMAAGSLLPHLLEGIVLVLLSGALIYVLLRYLVRRLQGEWQRRDATERRFGALFEHTPDAVFLTTPDGSVQSANAAAQAMLGLSEKQIVARGREGIVDSSDPRLVKLLRERQRKGHATGRLRVVRGNGEHFEAEVSTAVFESGDGLRSFVVAREMTDRMRRDAELFASEERYRSLFEHNPAGTCLVDPEGRFLEVNPAFCRICGQERSQLLGQSWGPLIAPEELETIREQFQSVLGGETRHYEATILRPDGERRVLDVANIPRFSDGEVTGVYGAVRDVTLEREFYSRVGVSEARHRSIFEHSMDGLLLLTSDGRILAANAAAQSIFGMTEEELKQHDRTDITDQSDPAVHESVEERKRTGRSRAVIRMVRADGEKFAAEISAVVFDGGPDGELVSVVVRDITERQERERELRESEDRFRALYEHSPDAILLVDAETGVNIAANPAAEQLFGMSRDDLVGRIRMTAENESDPALKHFLENRRNNWQARDTLMMRRGDGSRFPADVTSALFRDRQDRLCAITMVRDISHQQEREAQLEASEARYRNLYYQHPDAVFEVDSEGCILEVNEAATELTGYGSDELCGHSFEPLAHPDHLAAAWEHFQAVSREETRNFKIKGKRKNGQTFWAQVIATPRMKEGEVVGVAAIVRDIDAEHRAHQQLAASEARLRSVFDNSMDAILLSDPDSGRMLACNPAAEKLFGMSETELREQPRERMIDMTSPGLDTFLRERDEKGSARGTLRIRRADGTPVPVDATTSIFEDEEGRRRSSVMLRDISEQLERENALRESEDRFRALFEQSMDAIFITEPEGQIHDCNPAAEKLFGYSREQIRELGRSGLVDEEEPAFKQLMNLRREQDRARGEIHMRRQDGSWFLADLSIVGFKDINGDDRTSVVVRDITEQREREALLRESEERFRAIFESSPDAVFVVDPKDGRTLDANESAATLLRRPIEDMVGRVRDEDFETSDPRLETFVKERARTGHARGTLTMRRADGSTFPADVTSAMFTDREGRQRASVIIRDVTEQQAYEAALKANEERFRIVADNTGQAIYEIDLTSGRAVWAGACEKMFGIGAGQLECMTAGERLRHVPDGDRDHVAEQYRSAAERGGPYRISYRLDTVDGRAIEVEDSGVAIPETSRMYGVIQDMTEMRRLVRRLEDQKATLSELSATQQAILDALPAPVALLDEEGVIRFLNASWRRASGENGFLGSDSGLNDNYLNVCDEAAAHGSGFAGRAAAGIRDVTEGRKRLFDGEYATHSAENDRWFRQVVSPYRSGGMHGAVVAHLDVTDRVHAERQLELVAAAFGSADEPLLICNADLFVLDCNDAYVDLIGMSRKEIIGSKPAFLDIGHQARTVMQGMAQRGSWRGELLHRRTDGHLLTTRAGINEIRGEHGGGRFLVISLQDISNLREFERKVDYLSYHDALTGLPNREAMAEWFTQAADRNGKDSSIALVYLDLDRFKAVNESFGHSLGDELLIETASRLNQICADDDYVVRLGGDDFVVLFSEVKGREDAEKRATNLLQGIAAPFVRGKRRIFTSASAGIAIYPDDAESIEDLLRRADVAHASAKRQGRGLLRLFNASMHEEVAEQALIESHLREAIDNGELRLFYQPIVRLRDGRVLGMEALVRWDSLQLGMVSPTRFVRVAEETGLILDLGRWVFDATCRQVRRWLDEGVPFGRLSINLSPLQFQHDDLLLDIREALQKYDVPGHYLRIEITETVLMVDPDKALSVLEALRGMDIEIAVDDFGTGYSSMAYLRVFPLQYIKLDRAFIRDLPENRSDAVIVSSMVQLAKDLGMKVIAEGVETREQRDQLNGWHCDEAQGYYFSHPMDAPRVEALLNENSRLPDKNRRDG